MSKNDKRISSIDVAKLAGVSQSTVSRVFSPNANVSAEKRERVLHAAKRLGYHPNVFARNLITRTSNMVGVVIADVASSYYPYFLTEFNRRLSALGKQVLLYMVDPEQTADDVVPTLLEYQVEALLIAATTLSDETAMACANYGTPVVLFNRELTLPQVSSICVDNYGGGRLVADLFVQTSHQRMSYIAGIPSTQTNQQRERGFVEGLASHSIDLHSRKQGDYTYESGFTAAKEILSTSSRPDAIFCASDLMAMGALDAARELGISITHELSIVGFDDIPAAAWAGYQLTTVRQPMNQMLAVMMQTLEAQITNPAETVHRIFSGRIVHRQTVRN